VDGTGAEPLDDSVVVIEGKRIKTVGKKGEAQVPADAEVIDASGKTVMPGLIDAHTHPVDAPLIETRSDYPFLSYPLARSSSPVMALFGAAQILRNYLEFGTTTIRILHPAIPNAPELRGEWLVALRTAVDLGLIPGPRVVAAGVVHPTGGHFQAMVPPRLMPPGWWGADGVTEVRKQTRLCVLENVDLIKVLGTTGGDGLGHDAPKNQGYTLDEMKAIVDEARFKGIPVSVHAEGGPGLDVAAEALGKGDSMEHCFYLFEHDEAAKKMAEKDIFMVPTWTIKLREIEAEIDPKKKAEAIKMLKETQVASIHKALKAGVKIAAGADESPYDWSSVGVELHGYVKYGDIPPLEAIKWATKNCAECLALEDIGTIEEGKIADLIVVDGDPLKDITVLQDKKRMNTVIKEGRIVAQKGNLIWN
jgi:imidazolonepropionase-like amidohydrolase